MRKLIVLLMLVPMVAVAQVTAVPIQGTVSIDLAALKGAKGDTGATGAQGPQGPQGIPGASATVTYVNGVCSSGGISWACSSGTTPSPVNCVVSAFTQGPLVPATCPASGMQTRTDTRTILTQPANGGTACPALIQTVNVTCAAPVAGTWPDATNTGTPPGTTLRNCASTISASGTYDGCTFASLTVKASNVTIKNSLINGQVFPGDGLPGQQTGLVIQDTTINCHCLSQGASDTPTAVNGANFTLLRVNLYGSGHGVAVESNVIIQDSYIHDLGGNTDAHKDGIYVGDGTNVLVRHNNIECNDGSRGGCTAAIGLLSDFGTITNWTIDNNLLNTNGSYCFYGGGGPQKPYKPNHITFTNNHFGRKDNAKCGFYGPVAYFEVNAPGNVWSGNVWDDTGAAVPAEF